MVLELIINSINVWPGLIKMASISQYVGSAGKPQYCIVGDDCIITRHHGNTTECKLNNYNAEQKYYNNC